MATIKLYEDECYYRQLPDVCAECGGPATTTRAKNFSWYPAIAWIAIVFGLLPFLIIILILTKRMRVEVPLCSAHTNHWSRRNALVLSTFIGVAIVASVAVGFASTQNQPGSNDLMAYACVGSCVLLLAWVVVTAIAQSRAIRPTKITESFIELTNVHRHFADAMREARREGKRRRSRKIRYDDEREDYDDEAVRRRRPSAERFQDDDDDAF